MEFIDCPDVAAGFRSILRGWQVSEGAADGDDPMVSFQRRHGAYVWTSDRIPAPESWKKHPPRTAVEAVCDFHYYFLDWFGDENPGLFCLHAAAVRLGDGLAIFPSAQRAGKSTLVAELARRGHEVFCDDVLPVDARTREGIALGLLPRLRLPLPAKAPDGYRDFVEARRGLSDGSCVYLALRDGEIAPFGARRRIAAIVSLARENGCKTPAIQALPAAAAIKHLIHQNFAEKMPVKRIFEELHSLACGGACLELRYDRVEDAAALLEQRFSMARAKISALGSSQRA